MQWIAKSENALAIGVSLRDVTESDLPTFFEQQRDPVANLMAAFPARDRDAFMSHWTKILGGRTGTLKTVLYNGQVAGNVVSWEQAGRQEIGYWIGREYWGKGIATRALSEFVKHVRPRPLYAHVAKQNFASIRVLEKCGFTRFGEDRGSAGGRGEVVEEFIMILQQ